MSHLAHLKLNVGDKLPAPMMSESAEQALPDDARFKQQAADLVAFQARTGRHLLQEGGEAAAEAPAEAAGGESAGGEAAKPEEAAAPAGGESAAPAAAAAAEPAAADAGAGTGEDPNAQKVPHNWYVSGEVLVYGLYSADTFTHSYTCI